MTTTTYRPLHAIATEIAADWPKAMERGTNFFGGRNALLHPAGPYIEAMFALRSLQDTYGQDTARSIVSYFIGNAVSWRGETAKRVKAELRAALADKGATVVDPEPVVATVKYPPGSTEYEAYAAQLRAELANLKLDF